MRGILTVAGAFRIDDLQISVFAGGCESSRLEPLKAACKAANLVGGIG